MKKALRIVGIIPAILIVIAMIPVGYSLATRGCIPSHTRKELGIYMPYFYADDYEINESFTDSSAYYCFELNESETEKIKADIENNSAWLKYTGDKDEFTEIFTFFEEKMSYVDVNNCYMALYLFSSEEFVKPKDVPDRAVNIGCSVFDEPNGKYYYYEMIW